MFRLINYVPRDVYSSLIWYNVNNFTGYRVWKEEMEETSEVVSHDIVTFWSLSQLLPESLSSYFNAFVIAYLQRPLEYREEILKGITGQGNQDELIYSRETDFVRRMIHNDISPELIKNV